MAERPPDRTCERCGRRIEWRRKWARDWGNVKYCSAACRRRKPDAIDRALEDAILALLNARSRDATICPSEAARAVMPDGWRERMEDARAAARRLVAAGKLDITQQGRAVDPSTARGPIRLRLRR
jgi:hypothetical protein